MGESDTMAQALNHEQASALLDLLASDDAYRQLFTSDLGAAFAKLPGKPAVPADVTKGCCLRPTALADKATIAQARLKMIEGLSAMQPYIPKVLEAE